MRIGISTFQWADNYGAVLQAQALQSFLISQRHKVEIINFQPFKTPKGIKQLLAKNPTATLKKWESAYKRNLFENFRQKHMIRTPEVFHKAEDLKLLANRYDLLITGSDQVWNPKWLDQADGLRDFCFLKFAGEKTKKISYAASFGHGSATTIGETWQSKIGGDLQSFFAISVREESGINIVSQLVNRSDAIQTADPTLLLGKDHYERLIGGAQKRQAFVFSYMLHGLGRDAEKLEQFLCAENQKLLRCDAKQGLFKKGYVLPKPTEWLRLIRDARFVVTNSFHAVVFCLIFHTPFAAVLIEGEMGSMNSRILDLLGKVGLKDRAIYKNQEILSSSIGQEIDWKKVEENLSLIRLKSEDFLRINL
jgi:hypothetical protein